MASWVTYDLANTIFALGVGSLYFAEWLTDSAADLPSWFQRFDEPADLALAITLVKRGGRPASPHGTWEPVTRNDRP